jgi:glutamyl-tRNA reductase
MFITVHGLNHKTAPIAVRERVAFGSEELPEAVRDLCGFQGVCEALILSTCNRTELYCGVESLEGPSPVAWLAHNRAFAEGELKPFLYTLPNESAVRHVMRVASGLDSMLLGEPQILGQIKEAYTVAAGSGTLGPRLQRLFEHSFRVAKRIRTETTIGADPVSVAYAAVRLARQIFGDLSTRRALLVGAGDTVELAARHLVGQGCAGLFIANRSLARAQRLAALHGAHAVDLADLARVLPQVDVVITATGSRTPLITRAMVAEAMRVRRHHPMFLVDLAVPRDVEAGVADLEDIYLYSLDDLEAVVRDNLKARQAAAVEADEIVRLESLRYGDWLASLDAVGLVRALRADVRRSQEEVLAKARRRLASGAAPEEVLRFAVETLANRILHAPTVGIREGAIEGREEILALARELFALDRAPLPAAAAPDLPAPGASAAANPSVAAGPGPESI